MTCGDGSVQRFRGVYTAASEEGKQCKGSNMETKTCKGGCIGNIVVIHVSAKNFTNYSLL